MNTCRLTINHHPDTDQCGDDMITHSVHVEPVNVTAPQWVIEQATRHMCADPRHKAAHFLPDIDPAIRAMTEQGISTLVVLAPDYWDIEDAFWSRDHSRIANRLNRMPSLWGRHPQQTAVVVDLGAGTVTATSREQAWEAA